MAPEGLDLAVRVSAAATVDLGEDADREVFEAMDLPTVVEVVPHAVEVAVLDTGVVCVLASLVGLVRFTVACEELLSLHWDLHTLDVIIVNLRHEAALSWAVDVAEALDGVNAVAMIGFDIVTAFDFDDEDFPDGFDSVVDGFDTPEVTDDFDDVADGFDVVAQGFDDEDAADFFNAVAVDNFDDVSSLADVVADGFDAVPEDCFDAVVEDGFNAVVEDVFSAGPEDCFDAVPEDCFDAVVEDGLDVAGVGTVAVAFGFDAVVAFAFVDLTGAESFDPIGPDERILHVDSFDLVVADGFEDILDPDTVDSFDVVDVVFNLLEMVVSW